jgi:CheY-like chemotaxis protein
LSNLSANATRVVRPKPVILCVEDEPIYLLLRTKVLEKNGYTVIGVTSLAGALTALEEAPVCAVIADHMLQGTTGTQVATEMKKIKPDVPIILFSGKVPEHLNNVDVYVNKGEPTATFLDILRGVVNRSRCCRIRFPICRACECACGTVQIRQIAGIEMMVQRGI